MTYRRSIRHDRSAFTLIEIMVVVGLLVLLTGIMLVATTAVLDKRKRASTKQTMVLVTQAVEAFKDSVGSYPLAVPYDAWGNWPAFVNKMEWNGVGRDPKWTDYFFDDGVKPKYDIAAVMPTNIHMLAFQLSQVPESNRILGQIKGVVRVHHQMAFDGSSEEKWTKATDSCRINHPADDEERIVYQIHDGWGMPLRYWSSNSLKWADARGWNSEIQKVLTQQLQKANWGCFIESAGGDREFGWWAGGAFDDEAAADNIYSAD